MNMNIRFFCAQFAMSCFIETLRQNIHDDLLFNLVPVGRRARLMHFSDKTVDKIELETIGLYVKL